MSNAGHIVGNLTADPELRYTPAGKAYARFTVAVSHRKMNQATGQWEDGLTDFVRCAAFNADAEGVANLKKGNRVIALGDWQPTEWTDKEGVLRKDREFIVREIGPSSRYQIVTAQRQSRSDGNQGGYQNNGGNQGGYQNNQNNQGGGYQQPQQSSAPIDQSFDEQPF